MSLLEVEALSMHYGPPGARLEVLRQVDFQVEAGELVAITGASGSGKSTLLGLMAGLDRPSSGSVRVEGVDLGGLDQEALAAFRGRRLGFVFQSFRLLATLTAEENVRVPLELQGAADAGPRARALLARVGLEDRAGHLPAELSGGEQQRVALARALAPRPALVLADEPTGNLDSTTGEAMVALLLEAVREQGTTLVLVTHEASLAARADRVLTMEDGRLRPDGGPCPST